MKSLMKGTMKLTSTGLKKVAVISTGPADKTKILCVAVNYDDI